MNFTANEILELASLYATLAADYAARGYYDDAEQWRERAAVCGDGLDPCWDDARDHEATAHAYDDADYAAESARAHWEVATLLRRGERRARGR